MDKRKFISAFLCLMAAASCSTTKVLQDGEYRLAKNKIVVEGDKSFNTGKLDPYIKQKAISFSDGTLSLTYTTGPTAKERAGTNLYRRSESPRLCMNPTL